MSYILEALKKAQAERQLGNAPTIHAPQATPAAPGAAASRKPLYVGLGAGAAVVVAGALLFWRHAPAPASAPAVPGAGPAAVSAPAARVAGVPAPAPSRAPAVPDTLDVSAPPAPPEPAPRPVPARASAATGASTAPASAAAVTPASTSPSATPVAPAAKVPAAAPVAAAPAAAPDDSLPFLQQLPPAQQSGIPRVSFGGYMYSANPADRLLIVDKALRHEGEEVAPGLVLEKLLPRAAVMNYRGIRYRVAY